MKIWNLLEKLYAWEGRFFCKPGKIGRYETDNFNMLKIACDLVR